MSHGHQHQTTAYEPEAPDAWHTHTIDEHPQQAHAENVDARSVIIVGILGFGIVIASILFVVVYFSWYVNRLKTEREAFVETTGQPAIHTPALSARAEILNSAFTTFGVVNAEQQTVRVPINAAKDRVIEMYKSR